MDSLPSRGFISLLMDSSRDAGNLEDEMIVLVYCCMNDTEQEMTTCSRFLSLHNPQKVDASCLLECIGEAMHLLGVDNVLSQDSVLGIVTTSLVVLTFFCSWH